MKGWLTFQILDNFTNQFQLIPPKNTKQNIHASLYSACMFWHVKTYMLNTCNLSGACISEDRGLYVKGMYSAYIQDGGTGQINLTKQRQDGG